MLPRDPAQGDVRLIDWDGWRVDLATDDLAYMIALYWSPERRRRLERRTLERYHATLLEHGVGGYDADALWQDYRYSVLWQCATPVWQAAHKLGPWIWWPSLERLMLAIEDLGDVNVLAHIRATGQGSASGARVEAEGFHLWTMRAGRAVRFTTYERRDEALKAAGLK